MGVTGSWELVGIHGGFMGIHGEVMHLMEQLVRSPESRLGWVGGWWVGMFTVPRGFTRLGSTHRSGSTPPNVLSLSLSSLVLLFLIFSFLFLSTDSQTSTHPPQTYPRTYANTPIHTHKDTLHW